MAILKADTKYGKVVGVSEDGCTSFKGIPYAKPPIGELRFAPPVEPEAWEGERVCDKFSPSCYAARSRGDTVMAEDCLTVNVWTPANSTEEKLPVMFWIYGGGFQGGSSSESVFDGTALTKHGVVVVNFNYRCGALGFLALPELAARSETKTAGNYGILDEIAALKWVHDNIASFGGDPDRVLIHGQSAGGISCRILLASPLAKGLFQRAVVQSGGGLNEADLVRPMDELMDIGTKCLERLGWTFEDVMTRDAGEVNSKLCDIAKEVTEGKEVGVFQPCVDGYCITEVPGVSILNGEYQDDVDIICGTVAGDAWMFCRKVCAEIGKNDPVLRGFSYSPSQAWAARQARLGRKPIRTYYFERTQPARNSHFGRDGVYRYGLSCPHSSEIPYVFGTLAKKSDSFTDYDREISELMMSYWTNFAKTGDPNGEGLPQWPLYTSEAPVSLHVSDEGYAVENIVDDETGAYVQTYVEEHPGMLVSLDGFEK